MTLSEDAFSQAIGRSRAWMFALGILMIVAGTVAIIFPFVSTLGVEIAIGAMLVVAGIAQIIIAFRYPKWSKLLLGILIGLAWVIAGALLLLMPLEGIAVLTIVIAASFLAEGVLKLVFAFQMQQTPNWGWMLFDSMLAIVLGGLLLWQFPSSALWAIGTLAGINILFSGWTLIMLASATRQL